MVFKVLCKALDENSLQKTRLKLAFYVKKSEVSLS
ncbi:hypothetical protein MED121_15499 [Marinomonas sp. MED121]|nr:hypothetical protein MED121_15499 [Marinomonas sp. MED121]